MATRLFLMGVIILFFGVQLRAIDTFVLNEKVTSVINRRIEKKMAAADSVPRQAGAFDSLYDTQPRNITDLPTKRPISPPHWVGWSFLSIGAVLIVTCPLFRA